ncbi:MAG: lysophospholipid acyltransferase family protein [Acidobacteria bacterium]|nr:lysophospholipid acyltransferase family protein [Acidobacteriota bacterium]
MKAALIVATTALLRVVPPVIAAAVARMAGSFCWVLLTTRRGTLLENLAHTAPHATPAERQRLAHATFRNLALSVLDLLRGPHLSADQMRAMVQVEGRAYLDTAIAAGRGVLLVSPHLGAIELGGRCMSAFGYTVAGYAEDPADGRLRAVYRRYRNIEGVTVLPLGGSALSGVRWLRRGGSLTLFADRAIGTRAHVVRFCGGWRPLPAGVAALARQTGAAVLFSYLVREPGARSTYRWVIEPPPLEDLAGLDERALTELVADRLSAMVRCYPDQWFVFQPEWQTDGSFRDANPGSMSSKTVL